MKKLFCILSVLSILTISGYAQEPTQNNGKQQYADSIARHADRISIGVRGGWMGLMFNSDKISYQWGFDAFLDVQYAHYWRTVTRNQLGILTGVSVGYMGDKLNSMINDAYTRNTDCGVIDYTIKADNVQEAQEQVVVEIPLMFSMVLNNGFFLNVGPKFDIPVWNQRALGMDNPLVDAYFTDEGIHVINEEITGEITDAMLPATGARNLPSVNVLLGGDLGYEFHFRNGHSFAIGVYGSYGIYSIGKLVEKNCVVDITSPSNTAPATVKINSVTDTYSPKWNMYDVGLKLTYHIQWQ